MLSKFKKISLLICILVLFQSCATTKFNCEDKKACREVENNLAVISDFIYYSKGDIDSVLESAKFIEEISGHASEADVQFDGQQPPTSNDYYMWTAWYSVNHLKLRKVNNKIILNIN